MSQLTSRHSKLSSICLALLVLSTLTSCGDKKDLGAEVQMAIMPEATIVAPGRKSSCADLATAREAGTVPSQSIQGPFIYFPRFVIQWQSAERDLYISSIRLTVRGSGIANFEMKSYLDPDEITALIGTEVMRPKTFADSRQTGEGATAPEGYVAIDRSVVCGLGLGGLTLADGENTASFTAQVTVELIGYSSKQDFSEPEYVRKSVELSADYVQY